MNDINLNDDEKTIVIINHDHENNKMIHKISHLYIDQLKFTT